ncbi:MAG: hypothetical protein IJS56_02725 [Bacilli bacterium]|nr:hypothetical protein [Bacilli bacterium]
MDEKLKKLIIYISAGFIIVFIIIFTISACQGSSTSYESYQKKMEKSAKEYFKKHEDELPTDDKKTSEYSLKQMIEDKNIDDYTKAFKNKEAKCDGGVTVTNNNGYYLYTVELDCGEDYSTKKLTDKIIEDNLSESGKGLFEIGNEYVFKGDDVNNYVTFNDETWRIISIDENNNINLLQTKQSLECEYDKHYNIDINENGINKYYQGEGKDSNLRKCLAEYYKEELKDETKTYLATQKVCYAARSQDDITKDGSTECLENIEGEPLNLVNIYEFMRASIDEECITLKSTSCKNFNWMSTLKKTYTITPSTKKSNLAYTMSYGYISTATVDNKLYTLLKISIDGKINYKSGNGSKEDPYIIGDVTKKK